MVCSYRALPRPSTWFQTPGLSAIVVVCGPAVAAARRLGDRLADANAFFQF